MRWRDNFNRKYLQISLYVIITAIIIYSLSLLAKNAPVIIHDIMVKVRWLIKVIKPIIIGFIFAYLMDPVVCFFEKKYRKIKVIKIFRKFRAPRTWATVTSVFLLMITVLGLISILIFSVTNQLRLANFDDIVQLGQDYVKSWNTFYNSIKDKLNELNIQSQEIELYVSNATNYILNSLSDFAYAFLGSITNISGYLTTIIFSFIIGVYFMIDGRMFRNYTKKVCLALLNDKANQKVRRIVHDLDEVFSGYIRGQLTDAFLMMFIISLVLSVIGVKFAILIGVFAGLGNLIPYFGPIVAYISTSLVCLINGDFKIWIIAMIALAVVQAIDGNLIGPKLLSRSIKIHPLFIIISLIFGSALGGFLGMLLAVPIGAYVKLVASRFVGSRLKRKEMLNKSSIDDKKKNENN